MKKRKHQSVIHAPSDATREPKQKLAIVLGKMLGGSGTEFALAMEKTLSYGSCDLREDLIMSLTVCVLSGAKNAWAEGKKGKINLIFNKKPYYTRLSAKHTATESSTKKQTLGNQPIPKDLPSYWNVF